MVVSPSLDCVYLRTDDNPTEPHVTTRPQDHGPSNKRAYIAMGQENPPQSACSLKTAQRRVQPSDG